MAAGDTQITITGNLVEDPELRFTPAGQAVARLVRTHPIKITLFAGIWRFA